MHFLSEGAYRIGTQLSIILPAFSFSASSYFHEIPSKFSISHGRLLKFFRKAFQELKGLYTSTSLLSHVQQFILQKLRIYFIH